MKSSPASVTAAVLLLVVAAAIFYMRARNPEGFARLLSGTGSPVHSSSNESTAASAPSASGAAAKKPATATASTKPAQSLPAKMAAPATNAIKAANAQANAALNHEPASAPPPTTSPTPPAASSGIVESPTVTTAAGNVVSQAGSDTVNVVTPSSTPAPANPVQQSDSASSASAAGSADQTAAASTQWTPPAKLPQKPNWTWTTTDGHTYTDVKVVKVEPDHVMILDSDGGRQVDLATLPPDIQKLFNYDPTAAAQWAIPRMLEGNLVSLKDNALVPVDDAVLPTIKYYAIYYSASWCPPCHVFTTKLLRFYKTFKPAHPEFEVIFVSEDTNSKAMLDYMTSEGMPWPAFAYGQLVHPPGQFKAAGIESFANKGIPDLVLVDSTGQVLADSYQGDNYVGPQAVMDQIPSIVK